MSGWVKTHRQIIDWKYFKNSEIFHLFSTLVILANHKDGFVQDGTLVKRGQLMTSRKSLSKKTGISESKIYRILKCLEIEHQIEQLTSNKNSIITIVNYDFYQGDEQESEHQVNSGRTASEQRVNTNKNANNANNEKNAKKKQQISEQVLKLDDISESWNTVAQKYGLQHCPMQLGGVVYEAASNIKPFLETNGLTWSSYFEMLGRSNFLKTKKGSPLNLMWALKQENFFKAISGAFKDESKPGHKSRNPYLEQLAQLEGQNGLTEITSTQGSNLSDGLIIQPTTY